MAASTSANFSCFAYKNCLKNILTECYVDKEATLSHYGKISGWLTPIKNEAFDPVKIELQGDETFTVGRSLSNSFPLQASMFESEENRMYNKGSHH